MSLKFDFHSHILPENWPNFKNVSFRYLFINKWIYLNLFKKFGYSGWVEMKHTDDGKALMMKDDGTVFRPVDERVWSTSVRLKDMQNTGNKYCAFV